MKPNVVILGGGITGLICAYAFSRYSVNIKIIEPGIIGGDILTNEFKYIEDTNSVKKMFRDLELAYSGYSIRGGILLRGEVIKYPDQFKKLTRGEKERVYLDYYRKTRLKEPSNKDLRMAMSEPPKGKPKSALRTDSRLFIDCLFEHISDRGHRVIRDYIEAIGLRNIILKRSTIPYDYLVLTIPLWEVKKLAYWNVPDSVAMATNVLMVVAKYGGNVQWEYVYTPYTPGNAVHRFTTFGGAVYAVEVNGVLNPRMIDVCSDLNFLFKDVWYIQEIHERTSGHLLPLVMDEDEKIYWPDNVVPLGTFTEWDSNCTLDMVLDKAKKIGRRWFK
jgi:hypothetical protein